MVKIIPVNGVKINNIAKVTSTVTKPALEKTGHTIICSVMPGVITGEVSTFLRDFNITADEYNYFQLKKNPETGKHFKADVFQKAAAMNLYLGNDVLVTAPTGTGKTAIAEYIITKNLIDGKKTFYTTPLKALSNQKYREFCQIYGKNNVGIITGDTKINTDAPIVLMTTEVYRNMTASEYFNFENPQKELLKNNLGTVVFDELQNLGDIDRGGVWEQSIMFTPKDVQILSLSATIGNNEEINDWIASIKGRKGISVGVNNIIDEHYLPNRNHTRETVLINVPNKNRRVPLTFEYFQAIPDIKIPKGRSNKEKIKVKKNGISIYAKPAFETYKNLTKKLLKEDKLPAIYFIYSKKECRKLLKYLASECEELTTQKERSEIEKVIKQYKNAGVYLGESLNTDALMKGYAVHNAGLLPSQKQLIEELFQKKLIKVVLATETLSAGINMPARTVVISSPRKPSSTPDGGPDHKRNHTPNEFHQSAGRAGRPGYDTEGFCYVLFCNEAQRELYENLIKQPSNSLKSNFKVDYSFIASYLSEFSNEDILTSTFAKSLFAHNPKGGIDEGLVKDLVKAYNVRKNIMRKNYYMDNDGKLTIKGHLIKNLNGYEQIPIINLVSDKVLANLDAVQIAGVFGGLANIEYGTREGDSEKAFYSGGSVDLDFFEALRKAHYEIKNYEKLSSVLYPERSIIFNGDIVEHVYNWADLNSHHGNSRSNWKKMYFGNINTALHDEGSLFEEIAKTIDLLKQMKEVVSVGEVYSNSVADKSYYSDLGEKLREAINLLQREPIPDDEMQN